MEDADRRLRLRTSEGAREKFIVVDRARRVQPVCTATMMANVAYERGIKNRPAAHEPPIVLARTSAMVRQLEGEMQRVWSEEMIRDRHEWTPRLAEVCDALERARRVIEQVHTIG